MWLHCSSLFLHMKQSVLHFRFIQFRFTRSDFKLTLSWRRPILCRNQSIDSRTKSMDWFLYDIGLRHERVNVGWFGASDMTKYLKLSKIINFFKAGIWCCSKNCCFSQLSFVANNFRVITNGERVWGTFFILQSILEKHLERETFTQK